MHRSCRALAAGTASGEFPGQQGFSIVELVVVIVVAALLAVFAVPRFFDSEVFDERAWHDEIAAAVRLARVVALSSGCPVRVTLDASAYALHQQAAVGGHCDGGDASWPVAVTLVDGQTAAGSAPVGVALAPALTFIVDAVGRTDLAGDTTVAINTRALIIHAGSGYVSQ